MGWVYRLWLSATAATAASITPRVGGEGGQPGTHLLCQPQQPNYTVEKAFERVRWDILKREFDLKRKLNFIIHRCLNYVFFPQRCDFWDGEWQSATADPPGSTSCFPFKTPHQWRLGEWAHGAPGPGHREIKYYLHHTSATVKQYSHMIAQKYWCHLIAVSHLSFCSPGSSSQKKILMMLWPSLSPVHPPSWRHNTHRHLLPRSSLKT